MSAEQVIKQINDTNQMIQFGKLTIKLINRGHFVGRDAGNVPAARYFTEELIKALQIQLTGLEAELKATNEKAVPQSA